MIGDIRGASIVNDHCSIINLDLQADMPMHDGHKFDSISCLHVTEHIGLGR